ncbi:FecCD family ABC transporter permease [Sphingobium aquiterrae]|uniref:FecCD family ABC transporter permease n=1 Tax=Sphingobium aquiterrae TaxID=2038656 RepID=UPI003AFA116F
MSLPSRLSRLFAALLVLLAAAALLSMLVGSAAIAPGRLWSALWHPGDRIAGIILFDLRLPRTLLALSIGATLGLAGAVVQGYLRNPLADPSVLGTSNMAALGAVLAIYFGYADAWPMALPAAAILAAFLGLVVLFVLNRRSVSALTLILSGIAIGTVASAGISLALNLSPNPFAAAEITNWLLGSLDSRSMKHLWMALPGMAVGAMLLMRTGRAIDALALGEGTAISLGVDLARLRATILAAVALAVGSAVAVAGAIGFIGLIVPHLVRPFTDRAPSSTLMPSALAGAVLLTLADVAVRYVPTANELKLGVITAILGVPVFIAQIQRQGGEA